MMVLIIMNSEIRTKSMKKTFKTKMMFKTGTIEKTMILYQQKSAVT